jgi:hypothetical protein
MNVKTARRSRFQSGFEAKTRFELAVETAIVKLSDLFALNFVSALLFFLQSAEA